MKTQHYNIGAPRKSKPLCGQKGDKLKFAFWRKDVDCKQCINFMRVLKVGE